MRDKPKRRKATPEAALAVHPRHFAIPFCCTILAAWPLVYLAAPTRKSVQRWKWNASNPNRSMARAAAAGHPIVLTGSPVESWPALLHWTPSSLTARLATIPLVDVSANRTFMWSDHKRQMGTALGLQVSGARHDRINMDPSEFFAASRPAATTYRQMHARLRDHAALAELSVDAQPRAFLFLDEESAGMDDVTLWAGEAGTTSHTHYDAWPNAFTQVYGQKRFLLWAPEDWRGLALHPHAHPAHRGSQLDFDEHNGLLVGCTPPSWVQRMRSLWGGSDEDAVTTCAVPFCAELSPGEVLLLPPFWFHRVTSLTFSTALSALSLGEQGGRFDRACRQGLPAYLLDRTAPPTMRAALVRRFITSLVHALMPPDEASTYVRRALVETRYAPLDSAKPLRCEVPFGSCGEDPSAYIAAAAAAEEQEVVKRVAEALAPRPSARALDGVSHIILQDYIEHVAGFAVGISSLCGFLKGCF